MESHDLSFIFTGVQKVEKFGFEKLTEQIEGHDLELRFIFFRDVAALLDNSHSLPYTP